MGRGRAPVSTVDADEAHRFFDNKVAGVRASTDDAPPPSYTTAPTTCQLDDFRRLSTDEVVTAVRLLPDKQCQSYVINQSINQSLQAARPIEKKNHTHTVVT